MGSIKEDVNSALRKAYQKLDNNPNVPFLPGVHTNRAIVFNTKVWDRLIKHNKDKNIVHADIRKNDPHLFHELLGIYYGDMKMKDRLYPILSNKSVYCLQSFVLTPEIPVRRFYDRKKRLCDVLSEYGEADWYKADHMDHVEKILDTFHDDKLLAFKKNKFLYAAQLKNAVVPEYNLKDYLLIGQGFFEKKKPSRKKIPKDKRQYKGPFLQLIIRGPKKNFKKHLKLTGELIEVLEN
jgi:hypothetical protein